MRLDDIMISIQITDGVSQDINKALEKISCIQGKIVTDQEVKITSFDRRVMSTFDLTQKIVETLVPMGVLCNGDGYNKKTSRRDIHVVNNSTFLVERPSKGISLVYCKTEKFRMQFKGTRKEAALVMEQFLICKAVTLNVSDAEKIMEWLR
jgi:hypothetical protein